MRTLVIVLIAVGMLLGADEVAVVAAAKTLDSTTAAAPLLALWGVGSFAGGLLVARLGGGARTAAGLALVLGALTAGHLALIPAAGSVVALGAVLLLAGAAIAPTEATIYAMVDRAAPAGDHDRGVRLARHGDGGRRRRRSGRRRPARRRAGPAAGFALAGGAGALAVLITMLRSRTSRLAHRRPRAPVPTPARQQPAGAPARHGIGTRIRRQPALAQAGARRQRSDHHERQPQGDTMNTHPSTAQAQSRSHDTRWRLDPSASTAEFRVPHFWGLVTVKGHFERLDGYLEVDDRGQRQMTCDPHRPREPPAPVMTVAGDGGAQRASDGCSSRLASSDGPTRGSG